MDKRTGFELSSVIDEIRNELQAAAEGGRGKDIRFRVDGVDLEIKAALKKSEDVSCGFKVYVFSLGGGKKSEDEHTITVKLRLTPRKGKGDSAGPTGDFDISRTVSSMRSRRR
jgi:hypothetical protein